MANPDYTNESWRVIGDAPDYVVSDMGRIKRVIGTRYTCPPEGKLLKLIPGPTGHLSVNLRHEGKTISSSLVHRFVAKAFIGPQPSPLHEIAHWDGNPANNHVGNLRWATRSENIADMDRHGTRNTPRGEARWCAKLTEPDVIAIRAAVHLSERALAARFSVSRGAIRSARSRKTWAHVP